jgi:hypothetical protein
MYVYIFYSIKGIISGIINPFSLGEGKKILVMRIRLGRNKNEWYAGVYTGKGGISSLVNYKQSKSFLKILTVFKLKNLWICIVGKRALTSSL